ncbi:MAG: 8-amino-7-oxononanoate synthase [Geobacteraceae bacterium]|nr:8-amino-7-oxononanoate synthase [Geobacteraceae bacterium]
MGSFAGELDNLRERGLYRWMRRVRDARKTVAHIDGKDVLLLCSNNYLGLADHPLLKEAAILAINRFGVGTGASRLVSGTTDLHCQLEERIARFKGTQRALVFNSGYAANTGIIPALVGKGDIVFCDRLNHASIVDGCLLSRARLERYPHNDMSVLRRRLEEEGGRGRSLIVSDGVFSMDGDLAPLRELVALKREFGAMLMIDDAHGAGVLGRTGRGTAEHFDVQADIDIHMGTLGKAFGSFGAYAAASEEIIDYLVNRARSFIFSTSLPPSQMAASLAALDIIESAEGEELRHRLVSHWEFFRDGLRAAGFDTLKSETQIVPVVTGDPEKTMRFSAELFEAGVYVQGIRPPTVPTGGSRLRCALMACHESKDLQKVLELMENTGKRLGII